MVLFIIDNPNVAVTHRLFGPYEFVFMAENWKVYDEAGYLFEDWEWNPHARNGIRCRSEGYWADGLSVKKGVELPNIPK